MRVPTVLLAASLVAGCSADPGDQASSRESSPSMPSASESPTAESVAIRCDERLDTVTPAPDLSHVVDGALELPSLDEPALRTQPASRTDALGAGWSWAKHGIAVKGGHRVTLRVAPEDTNRMRMGWGFAPIEKGVTVVAECPAEPEWRAFPGGFWVERPGCYTVHVQVDDGEEQRARIGIGAPCAGQEPPA
ncbi:MAG TPA: hypothetical protein VI076_10710 [Actinopolymorphaceae bacterium]